MDRTLCELSYRIVSDVNKRLGRAARSNGRRRLQEVSTTATVLDLIDDANADGLPVWVQEFSSSEESQNGADIELWIADRSQNRSVGWLIQAKRLYPRRTPSSSPKFESIEHYVREFKQVDLLEAYARQKRGLNPVYWLYGWTFDSLDSVDPSSPCNCGPRSFKESVMVAPSSVVRNNWGSKSWHELIHQQDTVASLTSLWCIPWRGLGPWWVRSPFTRYAYEARDGLPDFVENLIRGEGEYRPTTLEFQSEEQRAADQPAIPIAPRALVVIEVNVGDS